jgi:hypothetical protein
MTAMRGKNYPVSLLWIMLIMGCLIAGPAEAEVKLSKGQTVYVPVYSHIYTGPKSHPMQLTSTLSIRNTDTDSPITILSVDYYDSKGNLVSQYLTENVSLKALASARYIVKEYDKSGGSGANFIVKWSSKEKVTPPIVESIMIGQRISFVSRGQEIED